MLDDETKKIPILGIQNAGKTSMIRTLQREFKSISKLKPTKGIERSQIKLLDNKIIIWDLAGQSKYRDQHLSKKKEEITFSDFDDCLYVIDIQDQSSFDESIKYFTSIKEKLIEYSPSARITLCIHKFDPGMEQIAENMKMIDSLKQMFSEIAAPLRINLLHTSIFNPLSIIHAFSKPILGNNTLNDNLGFLFEDFCKKNQNTEILDFIIIFSEDLVEIASYFKLGIEQIKLRDVAHKIFQNFTKKTLSLKEISFETDFTSVNMIQFNSNNNRFYFTYGFDVAQISNFETIKSEIEELLEAVKKLMIYF